MDKFLTGFGGGDPRMGLKEFALTPNSNQAAVFGLLRDLNAGAPFIISGCLPTLTATLAVTAGYIFLNNEVVQVDAQSGIVDSFAGVFHYVYTTTYDADGDKTFRDGTPRQTYQNNRGVATSVAAVTTLDVIDGARIEDLLVTPAYLESYTGLIKTKKVELGAKSFTSGGTFGIAHGLPTVAQIIDVQISIIADDQLTVRSLSFPRQVGGFEPSGDWYWDGTNIVYDVKTGYYFDSAAFAASVLNRGHAVISYFD